MKKKDSQKNTSDEPVFKTPQVKGKLLKRTRGALTGTKEQNANILRSLMTENSETIHPCLPSKFGPKISQETAEKVKGFFHCTEISRPSPNINDFVTVIENNQKIRLSVHHLLYTIKECHGMFAEENPETKISLSKFQKLRPTNVLSSTKIPHNVCVCEIHENLRYVMKTLSKSHPIFSELYVDNKMHRNFTCETEDIACFQDSCENCKHSQKLKILADQVEDKNQVVSWSKWVKRNKKNAVETSTFNQYCNIEKVKKTGSIEELLNGMYDQVPNFLDHEFVKLKQSNAAKKMTDEASVPDSNTAVVICDFSEKFKCLQQNATQSAHYGQTPVSLFTVAVYHRGLESYVLASDYEKHTKDCVIAYIDTIIELIPKTATVINIWSDNATSQFKNQYIMESLKYLEKFHPGRKIRWNFYAAMHGKSVVDGVGGSVKRFVKRKILAQDLIIKSAKDFTAVAEGMKIKVIHVSLEDIERKNIKLGLKAIIKTSSKIVNILKCHSFEVSSEQKGKRVFTKIEASKICLI